MRVNYRLEVEYQVFEKNKTFFETKSYVFNSNNSQQNRRKAIDKFESYQHVFDIASKETDFLKQSVLEVVNKNIYGFKIPSLNIYYSINDFDSINTGSKLFGNQIDDLYEQLLELEEERNTYKYYNINDFETETLFDNEGNSYKTIKENGVFNYELFDPDMLKFSL